MNVEAANAIPLSEILAKLRHFPVKENEKESWYDSPFRVEKTASFHVNKLKNVWYDFGSVKGGNVVDFICEYLQSHTEDHTVVDALRWLRNMHLSPAREQFSNADESVNDPTLRVRKVSTLQDQGLVNYLESRGIPLALARKYLKEIYIHNKNSEKTFCAVGMKNENGGYELRNKFFKGCIAPKYVSFVRGREILQEDIHVFEGFIDFLSALIHHEEKILSGDIIILNSLSCMSQSFPYINWKIHAI